jgi:DNA-binding NarL/FixJ family response regulator
VLEHLQSGRTNAEIAQQLQVGVETVRTHARNIYRKLGVRTRRELAIPAAINPAASARPVSARA